MAPMTKDDLNSLSLELLEKIEEFAQQYHMSISDAELDFIMTELDMILDRTFPNTDYLNYN
jgi:hypothetical protein